MIKFPLTKDKFELEQIEEIASKLRKKMSGWDDYQVQLYANLMAAISFRETPRLKKLLAEEVDVNFIYPGNETLLSRAAYWRLTEQTEVLLKAGADPLIPPGKDSPLQLALEYNAHGTLYLLMPYLPEEMLSEQFLGPLLHKAVTYHMNDFIHWLLQAGTPVDYPLTQYFDGKSHKQSPMMFAAFCNDLEQCEILLNAGANINYIDDRGWSVLDFAIESNRQRLGKKKFVTWLEKQGALPGKGAAEEKKEEPLFKAVKEPHFKELVARLSELTKKKPVNLAGLDKDIPGNGFLISEKRAKELVAAHQDGFLSEGAYLFYSKELATKSAGSLVCIVPVTDPLEVVRLVETEGPNENVYNKDLLKWLRTVMNQQDLRLTGIGTDFLEGEFLSPVKDPVKLARQIAKICSEAGESAEDIKRAAAQLEKTRRLFLWWD